MFESVRVSSVKRLAAISGRAAFLAPKISISPSSGRPPLMRILSMNRPWRRGRGAAVRPHVPDAAAPSAFAGAP